MKWLLPMIMLTGCQTPWEATLPNGTHFRDTGHLAGNVTTVIKPDGTLVRHGKFNQPFQDAMQTIGAVDTAVELGDVGTAAVRANEVKAVSASREVTRRAALRADVDKVRLATELEKFRLRFPTVTPLPAP